MPAHVFPLGAGNSDRYIRGGVRIENRGSVRWSDNGRLYGYDATTRGTASINNLEGGVFDFLGDGALTSDDSINAVTFEITNQGLLRRSGGGGTSSLKGTFYNSGLVEVSLGTVEFHHAFTQAPTGKLRLGLRGASPGSDFGPVRVTGLAVLAGSLEVESLNDFQPTNTARFAVMHYGSRNGTFSSLNTSKFPNVAFVPFYGSTTLEMVSVTRPAISPLIRQADAFTIATPGNWPLRIDASTNLVSWMAMTNFPAGPGPWQFMDPDAAAFRDRFYRAILLLPP